MATALSFFANFHDKMARNREVCEATEAEKPGNGPEKDGSLPHISKVGR